MAKSGSVMLLLIGVVVASVMVQFAAAQTVHVVGDNLGWTVPTTNSDFYDDWNDNKMFRVGDILTFNFASPDNNVVEVTEASYEQCTATNMIGSIITTSPANITLTSIGEHHYICTIGSRCQSGQKLEIDVIAAAPGTPSLPPPPPPTTPVTPAPSQSPPTTPGSMTPPPSQSPQTVHIVGDSIGWTVPTTNPDFYDDWNDNKIFRVGDILTFNFNSTNDNVVEVTEASYDTCTATNMIGSIITTGPANITLTSIGEHHYICTIGGRCQSGQKLEIDVIAAAPGTPSVPPPPPPTTPVTPPPSQSPPTTPGSMTPPPSQSPPTTPGSMTPAPSQSPPTNSPSTPTTPGSVTPPPTNGPTSSSTPGSITPTAATTPGSSSSVVLASVFVTLMSIAMGVFF